MKIRNISNVICWVLESMNDDVKMTDEEVENSMRRLMRKLFKGATNDDEQE